VPFVRDGYRPFVCAIALRVVGVPAGVQWTGPWSATGTARRWRERRQSGPGSVSELWAQDV
jgi:hypothetical protein